jgi:hypothetical protein
MELMSQKIKFKGTLHKSSELPKSLKFWKVKISEFIKNYTI